MKLRSLVVASCAVLLTTTHAAGAVTAKKPSELRTVRGDSETSAACFATGGFRVDVRQLPDGTTAPFSIPAGFVFVITSWDWQTSPAGSFSGVDLYIATAANTVDTPLSFVSNGRALGVPGFAGGSVTTPDGAVVKAGATLCAAGANHTAVVVRGFLVKDK